MAIFFIFQEECGTQLKKMQDPSLLTIKKLNCLVMS